MPLTQADIDKIAKASAKAVLDAPLTLTLPDGSHRESTLRRVINNIQLNQDQQAPKVRQILDAVTKLLGKATSPTP